MLLTQPNKYTVANRTIKNNHLFLVDDLVGGIPAGNDSGLGLYHLDTRFLSCLEILLMKTDPVCLLSSTELGYLSRLVHTNGQIESTTLDDRQCIIPEESIELKRESILDGALFERYTLTSFNIEPVRIQVSIKFDADFQDMFEIRHLVPVKERVLEPPRYADNTLIFAYQSPAGRFETHIIFKDFTPQFLDQTTIIYETMLFQNEISHFNLEIRTVSQPATHHEVVATGYDEALARINSHNHIWNEEVTRFTSDNQDFNEMVDRSHKDIRMLLSQTDDGRYFVAAGIPWYVALFGRDSIITARECLLFNTAIAKWTLYILAKYQGTKYEPIRDEEPGKILHELRTGELATQKAIPHTPYYGSVDSTPLWIILLVEYFQWTSDCQTVEELWPNAIAAMDWIDTKMSENEMGYVTYFSHAPLGIVHQGWKDSYNSAMYDNGIQAEPPIALSEVQGYVYLAKKGMASLAEQFGDKALKQRLHQECSALKTRFNQDFWLPDLSYVAMGLDNHGRPLKVVSSNPAHCLETGILTAVHAKHVVARLMKSDMFNGWGIRTLSSEMVAYNPMSYHNGTVWPHDNAIIAKGMADLGYKENTEKIFTGLYEAARLMAYKRLPELFCGFARDAGNTDPPVRYAVACSPQAWAAASIFMLIQSMLNITPDLKNGSLKINQPVLPVWMNSLQILNLRVGSATVNLEFKRSGSTVLVDVLDRHGKLDVLIKK
jgi:glycogen debranching enzyme